MHVSFAVFTMFEKVQQNQKEACYIQSSSSFVLCVFSWIPHQQECPLLALFFSITINNGRRSRASPKKETSHDVRARNARHATHDASSHHAGKVVPHHQIFHALQYVMNHTLSSPPSISNMQSLFTVLRPLLCLHHNAIRHHHNLQCQF